MSHIFCHFGLIFAFGLKLKMGFKDSWISKTVNCTLSCVRVLITTSTKNLLLPCLLCPCQKWGGGGGGGVKSGIKVVLTSTISGEVGVVTGLSDCSITC